MVGKTHNIAGFAALLTATIFYPPAKLTLATLLVSLVANGVGSLLPDADQASNKLWSLLPGGNWLGKFLKNVFLAHRTLSHSLLGVYLIYKLNYWLMPKLFNSNFIDYKIVAMALMIGYVTHLLADGITEEGLPLLFPIKWKFGFPPFKHLRIKTGHWVENWVVFPGIIVYIVYIGVTKWSLLLGILHLVQG